MSFGALDDEAYLTAVRIAKRHGVVIKIEQLAPMTAAIFIDGELLLTSSDFKVLTAFVSGYARGLIKS